MLSIQTLLGLYCKGSIRRTSIFLVWVEFGRPSSQDAFVNQFLDVLCRYPVATQVIITGDHILVFNLQSEAKLIEVSVEISLDFE